MLREDELTKVEHAVNRHDAAIIEEATTIGRIRREAALIIEALEKLKTYYFDALEHHPKREAARDRYCEILDQLKASRMPQGGGSDKIGVIGSKSLPLFEDRPCARSS